MQQTGASLTDAFTRQASSLQRSEAFYACKKGKIFDEPGVIVPKRGDVNHERATSIRNGRYYSLGDCDGDVALMAKTGFN